MTDVVGKDDEVARGVEQRCPAEQFAGKLGPDELRAASAGAVHDQHGVAHDAGCVAFGLAQCSVVNPQLRKTLARPELEVIQDEVMLFGRWILRRGDGRHHQRERGERE